MTDASAITVSADNVSPMGARLSEPYDSLRAELQARVDMLEQVGAAGSAQAIKWCIARLELAARNWELEELTLERAAAESGYSYSAVEKMVRRGELENVGRNGSPRVCRGDLPRKVRRSRRSMDAIPDIAERVLGFKSEPANDRLV